MKSKKAESNQPLVYELINLEGRLRAQMRPDYLCPTCEGRGFLFFEDERGISSMKECECTGLKKRLRLLNEANIPGKFADTKLETYHPVHPSQRLALRIAQDFVSDFADRIQGLVFMGKPGLGKTHLAIGILKSLILDYGVECKFVDFFQLLSDIRHGYSNDLSEQAIINPYVHARVLVIDELAKGRNTEWEHTMLDQIISHRYNAADRVTLFTTNYTDTDSDAGPAPGPERIDPVSRSYAERMTGGSLKERLGERIYSRLSEMCRFVKLEGEDYRPNIVVREGTRRKSPARKFN